jgi:hypothetical protein
MLGKLNKTLSVMSVRLYTKDPLNKQQVLRNVLRIYRIYLKLIKKELKLSTWHQMEFAYLDVN